MKFRRLTQEEHAAYMRLGSTMKITNTSDYANAAVEPIVRWAARELEVDTYVEDVKVTACRGAFGGRCWGRRVLLRVGSVERFPYRRAGYPGLKTAPQYDLADWRECLVMLCGHEFQHSRQYLANTPKSEIEAERVALWLLGRYRKDPEVAATLVEEMARLAELHQARSVAKAQRRAEREARERDPRTKLAAVNARIAAWERKRKMAETWLKKYRRRQRRLERAIDQATGTSTGN